MDMMFYHIYKSLLKNEGEKYAKWLSICLLAAIFAFNLMTVSIVLDMMGMGYLFKLIMGLEEVEMFGAYVIVSFLFYGIYFPKRQEKVIKDYSKRSLVRRKKGARLTLAYGLLSVILIFVLAPLR